MTTTAKIAKNSGGGTVCLPSEISHHIGEIDYLLITAQKYDIKHAIYLQAKEMGFPENKILVLFNKDAELSLETSERVIHEQDDEPLRKLLGKVYDEIMRGVELRQKNLQLVYKSDSGKKTLLTEPIFSGENYERDYVRFRTFELAAAEIRQRNIPGSTAELGVYRGVFSRLIHAHFPERKHFMYDSFEGFIPDEARYEVKRGLCSDVWAKGFTNTDVSIVMQGMPTPENTIIRRGFFPDSLEPGDENERFAFVSLDVDFEESTFQGLKFFYPRMTKGGYIFIHDYNAISIQSALQRFETYADVFLRLVHLPDKSGTVILPI